MNKGCDKNKYLFAKHTESSRVMRGAWETIREYLFELCTEPFYCSCKAKRIRLQRSSARYKRRGYQNSIELICRISILLWQLPEAGHVSGLRIKVVSRDFYPRPFLRTGIFCCFYILSLHSGYIGIFLIRNTPKTLLKA